MHIQWDTEFKGLGIVLMERFVHYSPGAFHPPPSCSPPGNQTMMEALAAGCVVVFSRWEQWWEMGGREESEVWVLIGGSLSERSHWVSVSLPPRSQLLSAAFLAGLPVRPPSGQGGSYSPGSLALGCWPVSCGASFSLVTMYQQSLHQMLF